MIDIRSGDIGKRPEITGNTTPVEYFDELILDRVSLCPLPRIENLDTVLRFDIAGNDAGSWTIEIKNGHLKRVIRNYPDPCLSPDDAVLKPASIFRMHGETLMSIIRREITPQQAFFRKMVRIEGDITIALKMNVLVNYL